MNTVMRRMDFVDGLRSVGEAYKDATDQLRMEDASTNQRVLDLIKFWGEIFSNEFEFAETHVDPVLADPKSISDYETAVKNLAVSIRGRDLPNIELWSETLFDVLGRYVREVEKLAIDRVAKVSAHGGNAVQSTVSNERRTAGLMVNRLEQIGLSHQLRVANRLAKTAVQEAQRAAEDARTAAGVASRSKLTTRFEALAKKHFWAATLFRILTAAGVLVGIWAILNVPLGEVTSGTDTATAEAILRVSLLAGVLGLATYFGRQAAYHRDVSTWASTIKEQLLTFDGYIDPVDDANLRDQMRAAFAARVFGSSPESKEEPGVTLSSPVLSEVAAIFTKAGSPRP